ncbi:MAG: hypothetical protein USCAAHI_01549 [Beijerinckiaceae bacterium]|jgi:hypothetical protein|nr:MAG: hypothetical protein USCAAHI_01549 [Beijerinckiaceae bacterium]
MRGDEGARPARRLDDDDRPAKTRDNPVAAGKVASPRFPTERHFADYRALFDDLFKESFMFGRVNIPQTACKDRDRSTLDRCLMRPCVDPAREAGDDDMPGSRNSAGKLRREGKPGRRCIAGADNRDFRAPKARNIAAHGDHGRRRSRTPKQRRIVRLAKPDKTRPRAERRLDRPLDFLDGRDADRPALPLAIRAGNAAISAGNAASAAPALPWRLSKTWNVRGPIFSQRRSRSQSKRSLSSRGASVSAESWVSSIKLSRSATPCPPQAAKYWRDV